MHNVINQFNFEWGFPQCASTIDVSHILVKAPVDFHVDCYNRKLQLTVIISSLIFTLAGQAKSMIQEFLQVHHCS